MSFLFSQPAPGILPANSVDFSEVETIASNTLLGNNTGSDSVILELSKTQATAMLDAMGAASAGAGGLKGLVPASSAGDQAKFLRGDATWATAGVDTSGALDQQVLAYDSGTGSTTWQYAGLGDGSLPSNTIILGRDLPSGTTATSGILIGTGSNLGTGTSQVIIGASSGRSTTGATGANNTVVGAGSFNSASLTSSANNTIVGQSCGTEITTGSTNTIVGRNLGTALTTGSGNIFLGGATISGITTSSNNVIISPSSTWSTNTNGNICIGTASNGGVLGFSNMIVMGTSASVVGNGAISIGNSCYAYGNQSVAIGNSAAAQGTSTIAIGNGAGVPGAAGSYMVYFGHEAKNLINDNTDGACFFGSSASQHRIWYLNRGGSSITSGSNFIMTVTPTTGTNISASTQTFTIQGAAGTGNAVGGDLIFSTVPAGVAGSTRNTAVERLRITAATGVVVNDTGIDFDFRVEGDTDQNLVFVDASTDRVGIGTEIPAAKLEVDGDILASEVAVANYKLHPVSHSHTQNSDGAHTINWANAPIQILTLNANITSLTFLNTVEGGAYLIKIVQGASGGPYTISWPTIKWLGGAPTLSTAANAVDVVSLTYVGGEYLAVASIGFV